MDEDKRKEVLAHLEQLRSGVERRTGRDEQSDAPVLAHVEDLRSLVEREHQDAAASANGLERRLLAWESEHPQLVALAGRVARALEDVGL